MANGHRRVNVRSLTSFTSLISLTLILSVFLPLSFLRPRRSTSKLFARTPRRSLRSLLRYDRRGYISTETRAIKDKRRSTVGRG